MHRRAPAEGVVPEDVAEIRLSSEPVAWRSLLPTEPLNDVSSARSGSEPERRLLDRQGMGQGLALEGEVGDVHAAARRDLAVLLLVDGRHPGAHRRVGRDGAGELVDPLELDRATEVGQIQLALDLEIHVGIGQRRLEHQRRIHRVGAEQQVEAVELHHGAVGAAAGIGERQIQEDGAGREREIGILERGVVHLGVQRERREGAVAVLALDPAVEP